MSSPPTKKQATAIRKCKMCGADIENKLSKVLEHAVIQHGDKEAADLLERMNWIGGA